NSNGVCHAITKEWIDAYTTSRDHRSDFVNSFRSYSGGERSESIPQQFIESQRVAQAMVDGHNTLVSQCRQFAAAYKSSEDPTARSQLYTAFQKRLPMIKNFEKHLYGDAFEVTKWPANTNLRQVVDAFSRDPGYYMLSFRRPTKGGGHVVGFEI